MAIKHIIFDLDGTLIDSSESILIAFDGAFKKAGLTPIRPLTKDIIGPPLQQALTLLSGSQDLVVLENLSNLFKTHYDTVGYLQTVVFEGVTEMLAALSLTPADLYIATNKRIKPTLLILEHLGWLGYFKGVYALDSVKVLAKNKSEMLTNILLKHGIAPSTAFYVGDRVEDKEAALNNALNFTYASWGYGLETQADESVKSFYSPNTMRDFFQKIVE